MQKAEDFFDMKAVIAEIKERASKRNYDDIPDFDEYEDEYEANEFSHRDFREELRNMQLNYEVSTETPFPANGVKGLAKRTIRKVNRFWAAPMAAQQTSFNHSASESFHQINHFIGQQQHAISLLKQQICELENRINELLKEQEK